MSRVWLIVVACLITLAVAQDQLDDDDDSWGHRRKPNFLVFLADDLGYGDLSCNGSPNIRTPNIDTLAFTGKKLSSFYAQPMCTPTRAALLTGRFPIRNGCYNPTATQQSNGAWAPPVLYPRSFGMLPETEVLISQVLKEVGYTNGLFGKWHLGTINSTALPLQRGFDRYWGMPYSSDMGCPPGVGYPCLNTAGPADTWVPVPLYDNNDIIEQPTTFEDFTPRLTSQVIDFIEGAARKRTPFFAAVNWVTPHVPLFTAPEFAGVSTQGLYGDTVEEIDASVGHIVRALKRLRIEDDTLVVFLSDNGAPVYFRTAGGSTGPFNGGKTQTYEGGVRVPSIWNWPGQIAPNSHDHSITAITDLFVTFASIANAPIPDDRPYDGVDISNVLFNNEPSSRECYPYYIQEELCAVRCGAFKLHYKTKASVLAVPVQEPVPLLYNVNSDPGELYKLDLVAFSAEVDKLNAYKDAWLAQLTPGPAQFQLYNTTADAYQPCCDVTNDCYCPPASTAKPSLATIRQMQESTEIATEALCAAGVPAFGPASHFLVN